MSHLNRLNIIVISFYRHNNERHHDGALLVLQHVVEFSESLNEKVYSFILVLLASGCEEVESVVKIEIHVSDKMSAKLSEQCCMHYTVCHTQCAVCSVQCAVPCTRYSDFKVCSVQCAVRLLYRINSLMTSLYFFCKFWNS